MVIKGAPTKFPLGIQLITTIDIMHINKKMGTNIFTLI